MPEVMNVKLSHQPAAPQWGKSTILSFENNNAVIHASAGDNAKTIQMAARRLDSNGIKTVRLEGDEWDTESQWAFSLGYYNAKQTSSVMFCDNDATDMEALQAMVHASQWTREMINLPPMDIYPESLARRSIDFIRQLAPNSVSYEIIRGDDLAEKGWMGTHSVGRASERQPVMLQLDYNPSGDDNAPVDAVLVGKGITFDSGGYSIKASEGMLTMKCDMGGAATVTGGLGLAIARGLNKRVRLVLCCAENLINGNAYLLGDVITYKDGTTVEVVNTDAEGRLVMADGLIYANEIGAPMVIDAATLTGAALVAVGTEYNALFALDKDMQQQVLANAADENEPLWPLPLEKWHQDNCPSPYADTANSRPQKGGGMGGASNAAGFLSRFVGNEGKGWVHIDLAAAFQNANGAMWAAGATGTGIRTIAKTLADS